MVLNDNGKFPDDMNRLSLATWNINSVRLRIDRVIAFLKREKPDVLCLQEIKCLEDQFPAEGIRSGGLTSTSTSPARRACTASPSSRKPADQAA